MRNDYSVLVSVLHTDEYYQVDAWPHEGDKIELKPLDKRPGGRVANTACVMARLGNDVRFFDVLSCDNSDRFLLEDLQLYGVDTANITYVDGLVNSKCLNILSEKDKTCLKIVQPKPQVTLDARQWDMFLHAKYIYCALGFHELIKNPKEAFTSFIKHGARLAMDVEEGFSDPDMTYYFEISDILFFNHFGFTSNCEIAGGEQLFLSSLFAKGVKLIIVTLGKDGCRVVTKDKDFMEAAYDIDVVDPSGAGDTFNGAFLHGLLQGWSIERCAKFSIAAANYCVAAYGPRSGAVSEQEIVAFMKKLG